MKKCISLIICAVLLMTMAVPMAIPAGAMGNTSTLISQAGTNEYPAPDIATIEAGEAVMGELEAIKAPTLDGVISEREYREMDRIEAAQLMGVFGIEAGWNPQALKEFAEVCDTLIPYWGAGWDGKYLYLAFEVNTENIDFFNALTTDNVYLYANTCFQVGVANADATGNNFSETGYGISTQQGHEGQPVSYAWAGNYTPVSGEDFACSWDQTEKRAVYEIRIDLGVALGHAVESGSQIRLAWCYMIGEGTSNMNASHALMYAHGITGRMSYKNAQAFATLTLTGDPENAGEIPEMTEEEKADREHGLKETVDFSKQAVTENFAPEINNATVTYMTEGDTSFARFSATEADALVASTKYPRAVNADMIHYVAVRYRTSSPGAEELSIAYRNALSDTGYDENYNGDFIYNDGTWRTMVLDMAGATGWNRFISEMAFLLPKGDIDIQWVKFFTDDVFEYYEEDEPVEQVTTAAATETAAPDTATESSTEQGTGAISTTSAVTDAVAETTAAGSKSSGCGSVLALSGVCALVVLCGGAVALKRKK